MLSWRKEDLGSALLLDDWSSFLGRFIGDVLVVPQPADLRVGASGDVGVDADLLALFDAHAGLHAGVKGDLWFLCKAKLVFQ